MPMARMTSATDTSPLSSQSATQVIGGPGVTVMLGVGVAVNVPLGGGVEPTVAVAVGVPSPEQGSEAATSTRTPALFSAVMSAQVKSARLLRVLVVLCSE